MDNVAYCFITDGVDVGNHIYAVESLRRNVPDAVCITLHDGGYSSRLPAEETVDFRGEFERIFGKYEAGIVGGIRRASFARYIIQYVVYGRFSRIVYLDNDAIVVSPRFADIETVDIGDCDIGACRYVLPRAPQLVKDLSSHTGERPKGDYFHTGVMVLRGTINDGSDILLANAYRELFYKNMSVPVHDFANWRLKIAPIDQRFNNIVPSVDPKTACCIHYSGDKKWLIPAVASGRVSWMF